jgi:RecJ-like exonuclease
VRYFNGRDRIEDTIVGIVAGMLLGTPEVPADRPIIAFAQSMDGTCTVKVSGRGTRDMTRRGLDLSLAMRTASEIVGGTGGGHNIAAGATVPEGREDEFLLVIDGIVLSQLSPSA